MHVLLLGPSHKNDQHRDFLERRGVKVTSWDGELDIRELVENKIDWIISNGYGPVIKEPIISEYRGRIVNIRPAYLPDGY